MNLTSKKLLPFTLLFFFTIGAVTEINLAGPRIIGNLPVANGGTGQATASANSIFAGPDSGAAAAPAFRNSFFLFPYITSPYIKRWTALVEPGGNADFRGGNSGNGLTGAFGTRGNVNLNSGTGSNSVCLNASLNAATATEPVYGRTTTGATTNGQTGCSSVTHGTSDNNYYSEWMVRISAITNVRFWITTGTGLPNTSVDSNATTDSIGFRYSTSASDTNFMCVTTDHTTQNVVSSGVAADTNFHRFAWLLDRSNAKAYFWIDNNLVCSSPVTSNLPRTAQNVAWSTTITTLTTSAVTFDVAWIFMNGDL